LNGRKILDSGKAQQIPLRVSFFSLKKLRFHYRKARNKHFFKPEERASDPEQLLYGISGEEQPSTSRCGTTEPTLTRFLQESMLVNEAGHGFKNKLTLVGHF
jgi:hypothetical protein